MKIKEWKDVIFLDPPKIGSITAESVQDIKKKTFRYRGSVRLATGRVIIDDEYNKKRKSILQKPLP